jgi:putative endonuclease
MLGAWGEEQAARFLQEKGLRIIERGFLTRWGEIDLIARDKDTVVFVEVKSRTRASQPSAADAISPAKQKKLIKAALIYMKKHRLENAALRFDVVLIEGSAIEWLRDAFEGSLGYTY